jgi:hypothetical protein
MFTPRVLRSKLNNSHTPGFAWSKRAWPLLADNTSSFSTLRPGARTIVRRASFDETKAARHREALVIDSALVITGTLFSKSRRWSIGTPQRLSEMDLSPRGRDCQRLSTQMYDEVESINGHVEAIGELLPKIKLSTSDNTLAVSIPSAETSSSRLGRPPSPLTLALRRGRNAPASLSFQRSDQSEAIGTYPELPTPFLFSPPSDSIASLQFTKTVHVPSESALSLDTEGMIGQLRDMIRTLKPSTPIDVEHNLLEEGEERIIIASPSTDSIASHETHRSAPLSVVSEDEWAFARDFMASSGDPLPPRLPRKISRAGLGTADIDAPPVPDIPASLMAIVTECAATVKPTPAPKASTGVKAPSTTKASTKPKVLGAVKPPAVILKDTLLPKGNLVSHPPHRAQASPASKPPSLRVSSDKAGVLLRPAQRTPSPTPKFQTGAVPRTKVTPAPSRQPGRATSTGKVQTVRRSTPTRAVPTTEHVAQNRPGSASGRILNLPLASPRCAVPPSGVAISGPRSVSPSGAGPVALTSALPPAGKDPVQRPPSAPRTASIWTPSRHVSTCGPPSSSRSRSPSGSTALLDKHGSVPVLAGAPSVPNVVFAAELSTPVTLPRFSAFDASFSASQPRSILKQPKSVRFAVNKSKPEPVVNPMQSPPRFSVTPHLSSALRKAQAPSEEESPTRPPPGRVLRTKKSRSAQLERREPMALGPMERRRSFHATPRAPGESVAGEGCGDYLTADMDVAGTPSVLNGKVVTKGRRSFSLLSPSGDKENRFRLSLSSGGTGSQAKHDVQAGDPVSRREDMPRKSPFRSILGKFGV